MKQNKIYIILISIILVVIGLIIFMVLINNQDLDETRIEGVNFSLNELSNKYNELNTGYTSRVSDNKLIVTSYNEIEFIVENKTLSTTSDNGEVLNIYKDLLLAVTSFYDSNTAGYEETIDYFLDEKIKIEGLGYIYENNLYTLSMILDKPIEKYINQNSLDMNSLIGIEETLFDIKNDDYQIKNADLIYDEFAKYLIFTGILISDNTDVLISLKTYDKEEEFLLEEVIDISEITFEDKKEILLNINLNNQDTTYEDIKYYSILVEEK